MDRGTLILIMVRELERQEKEGRSALYIGNDDYSGYALDGPVDLGALADAVIKGWK